MAPFLFFFLLHLPLYLSQITELPPPSILLPVSKDGPTGQYLVQIHAPKPSKVVVDLGSSLLWLDCGPARPSPIHCRSIQCSSARAHHSCPIPDSATCTLPLYNPITDVPFSGELVQGTISLGSSISAVDQFLFSCAPSILLKGLAAGATGVLGLGHTRVGAPSQISHSFGYSNKFSLCLSSNNGMVFSGNLGDFEVSKSLLYTPLLPKIGNDGYFINLKAIKIRNKKLSFGFTPEVSPSVKISTASAYTKMESRIYQVFIKAFAMAAKASNMTRAPVSAPFELCFSESEVAVPVVDLVLQSEMVKWRIYGHNSMVKVGEGVMCLGVLDGGLDLDSSVVLGGHQLEDNLLEFDLGSLMLGFSSLVKKQMSCSKLTSLGLQKDSQVQPV